MTKYWYSVYWTDSDSGREAKVCENVKKSLGVAVFKYEKTYRPEGENGLCTLLLTRCVKTSPSILRHARP